METAEKELTLEEAFLRLEEVTRALEDENISLEESFAVYQKGMELIASWRVENVCARF